MLSCSLLRSDALDLARSSDSEELRKLAMIAAELCRKIEELERELKEVRPETPAMAGAIGGKPR